LLLSYPDSIVRKAITTIWRDHKIWLFVAVAFVAATVVIGYLVVKRPGDVSNPDAAFVEMGPGKEVIGIVDWPVYGRFPERTRYMNVEQLEPPFKVAWRLNGRKLLEYSPIIVDGSLYAVNNNGEAFSAKSRSGKVRWRRDIARLNASSPAYNEGQLYVATLEPGMVHALNAKNGVTRWTRELPGRTESSPVVVDGKVIVGCECGTLFAFDEKTGKTEWETDLPGQIKAAPAVSEGIAYIGDYSGTMSAVRVSNGDIKWQSGSQGSSFGRSGRIYATAAVAFGRVYVGSLDSRMYSFEKDTGDLAWSHSTGGYVYSAPVLADTPNTEPTVYFGSYDGTFYALDARSGDERWTADAGGSVSGAASLIGNTVYVGNLPNTETFGFNAANGDKVWTFRDGAYNPIVSDGRRIYLTGKKQIYSMKPINRNGGVKGKKAKKGAKGKKKKSGKKKRNKKKNKKGKGKKK
jgi:outer membrane protein assembly factor BamB